MSTVYQLDLRGQFTTVCSLDILKSWVDLIDEDGWVAREQILGEEARSKVSLIHTLRDMNHS